MSPTSTLILCQAEKQRDSRVRLEVLRQKDEMCQSAVASPEVKRRLQEVGAHSYFFFFYFYYSGDPAEEEKGGSIFYGQSPGECPTLLLLYSYSAPTQLPTPGAESFSPRPASLALLLLLLPLHCSGRLVASPAPAHSTTTVSAPSTTTASAVATTAAPVPATTKYPAPITTTAPTTAAPATTTAPTPPLLLVQVQSESNLLKIKTKRGERAGGAPYSRGISHHLQVGRSRSRSRIQSSKV